MTTRKAVKEGTAKKTRKRTQNPITTTGDGAVRKGGHDHPSIRRARLLEQTSPALLEDMHEVLGRHGFAGTRIRSLALTEGNEDPQPNSTLCKRWRCHTDGNGDTVCGWVWEPCD